MITAPQIIASADLASVAVPTGLTAVAGCVLTALGFLLRARLAAKAEHREDRREDREKRKDEQSDTASLLNSQRVALDAAFKREQVLRGQLDKRDAALEKERRERREERERYEAQLEQLEERVQGLFAEVKTLRAQLHPEGDDI